MTLTFDLILIGRRGLMTDYPCGQFCDCSFSRFSSIVRTDAQTDADERFTPATLVGVSKYWNDVLFGFFTLQQQQQRSTAVVHNLLTSPINSTPPLYVERDFDKDEQC